MYRHAHVVVLTQIFPWQMLAHSRRWRIMISTKKKPRTWSSQKGLIKIDVTAGTESLQWKKIRCRPEHSLEKLYIDNVNSFWLIIWRESRSWIKIYELSSGDEKGAIKSTHQTWMEEKMLEILMKAQRKVFNVLEDLLHGSTNLPLLFSRVFRVPSTPITMHA